jgi:hypothetical protein
MAICITANKGPDVRSVAKTGKDRSSYANVSQDKILFPKRHFSGRYLRAFFNMAYYRFAFSMLSSHLKTERAGFEPAVPKGHTGFRNRLDQPLRHLSVIS